MTKKLVSVAVAALAAYLASYGYAGSRSVAVAEEVPVPAPIVAPAPPQEPEAPAPDATLSAICGCESAGNPRATPYQFNADGTVLRGRVNPQDVGMCQINERYHLADSIALGYDIYTAEGNWGYATYLLETQGTTPWNWSRHCWGPSEG